MSSSIVKFPTIKGWYIDACSTGVVIVVSNRFVVAPSVVATVMCYVIIEENEVSTAIANIDACALFGTGACGQHKIQIGTIQFKGQGFACGR